MKRFGVFIAGAALILAGCSSTSFKPQTNFTLLTAGYQDYTVRLRPRNDGTIDLPPNSRCGGNGNNDGCLSFPVGAYGVINFSVSGPGFDDKTCSDRGVQWVITKVQIAETGDINTGKSTHFDKPVSLATQAALYPFKRPGKGTIYEATRDQGSTTVHVLNRNDITSGTTTNLWYRVEATECDAPHTLAKTDPRIENRGR